MRYELKYAVDHLTHEAVIAQLGMHPASLTELYPDRQINNYYFDTPDFSCYHQNVEGQPRRQKMRLRWYGTSQYPTSTSTLEIKQKDRELGWKDSYNVASNIHDQVSLMTAVQQAGILQSELQPVLKNTYIRSYFVSQDGLFRVTVDREQTFTLPFAGLPALQLQRHPIVIEVKFEQEHHARSSDITQYMTFRQTKNSKYATGVEVLYM